MWRKLSPARPATVTPSADVLQTKDYFEQAQRDIDQTISVLEARTAMLMEEAHRHDHR